MLASTTGRYELSERAVASADFLPASTQVSVSDTPSRMPDRQMNRSSSELLEFLRFPS